ncbi:MAG: rod shape-determining protein MreD [Caldilineae bacterium]|nr:MAG: rod shape-determining protein MreD [Caldilineae bacterium]
MSSLFLFLPIALVVVTLQATVMHHLSLGSARPDLIIISLVLWTMSTGRDRALLPAILMAPLFDAVAGLPLGVSVVPLLIVVLIASIGERTLFGARLGWPIFAAFTASLAAGAITLLELRLLGWRTPWTDLILRILVPSALLNAFLVFLIFIPVEYLRSRRSFGLG